MVHPFYSAFEGSDRWWRVRGREGSVGGRRKVRSSSIDLREGFVYPGPRVGRVLSFVYSSPFGEGGKRGGRGGDEVPTKTRQGGCVGREKGRTETDGDRSGCLKRMREGGIEVENTGVRRGRILCSLARWSTGHETTRDRKGSGSGGPTRPLGTDLSEETVCDNTLGPRDSCGDDGGNGDFHFCAHFTCATWWVNENPPLPGKGPL